MLLAITQQLSALEKSLQPAAPTALSALLGPSALLYPHWVARRCFNQPLPDDLYQVGPP